jgi:hypothetical protein
MDWMVLAERLPNTPEETLPCMGPSEYPVEQVLKRTNSKSISF